MKRCEGINRNRNVMSVALKKLSQRSYLLFHLQNLKGEKRILQNLKGEKEKNFNRRKTS